MKIGKAIQNIQITARRAVNETTMTTTQNAIVSDVFRFKIVKAFYFNYKKGSVLHYFFNKIFFYFDFMYCLPW